MLVFRISFNLFLKPLLLPQSMSLLQLVPSVNNPLWEKVFPSIQVTSVFDNFPTWLRKTQGQDESKGVWVEQDNRRQTFWSVSVAYWSVMLSPRGQSGLEAKILASASKLWPRPRPQTFGLGLVSISLSYYVIGHFSGKNRVKFGNFVNFSGSNLKSYLVHFS